MIWQTTPMQECPKSASTIGRHLLLALFSFEGSTRDLREGKEVESGGESKEDPPVPMPNTEVKLFSVDGTWRETARESRTLPEPTFYPEYSKW